MPVGETGGLPPRLGRPLSSIARIFRSRVVATSMTMVFTPLFCGGGDIESVGRGDPGADTDAVHPDFRRLIAVADGQFLDPFRQFHATSYR